MGDASVMVVGSRVDVEMDVESRFAAVVEEYVAVASGISLSGACSTELGAGREIGVEGGEKEIAVGETAFAATQLGAAGKIIVAGGEREIAVGETAIAVRQLGAAGEIIVAGREREITVDETPFASTLVITSPAFS